MPDFFSLGYLGLFIASFLAATVIPFSSEAVLTAMVLGGFDPLRCFVLATIGNWLGGLTNWYVGHLGKLEWATRFLGIKPARLQQAKTLADRYGSYLALLAWAPFLGDAIALALGLFRVPFLPTAALMLVGKALRYAVVAWLSGLMI